MSSVSPYPNPTSTPVASDPIPTPEPPRAGAIVPPPGDGPWTLEAASVTKYFGPTAALYDVSFRVPAGQIVGLLGPNGAGKSTMMKSILGIVRPDHGSIRVLGTEVRDHAVQVRREVGYVPEWPALYEFLTGAEY